MRGWVRRRGLGILALAALAACAGDRAPEAASGAADAAALQDGGAAGAVDDTVPAVPPGSRAGKGEPVHPVVPSAMDSAQPADAPAAQPPDVLALDSLPPPPDPAEAVRLAAQGARILRAKDCTRCHTIGAGDRDGPDLAGVTERRSYRWIIAMLTQPEYMVQADHTAQQLLIEHFREMPNLEVTLEEARAVWAYLQTGGRR